MLLQNMTTTVAHQLLVTNVFSEKQEVEMAHF